MNRSLTLIAAVSLSVAAACAALMFLIRGEPLAALAHSCGAAANGSSQLDLAWGGGDRIAVDIPARVLYQPGPVAQATVSGDPAVIAHVRMRQGTLTWDTPDWDQAFDCRDPLIVRLSGPAVNSWTINGSGRLELSELQQELLRIATHGPAAVTATGAVQQASLETAGSGRADLGRLLAQHMKANVYGSGEVDLAPRQDADITIRGNATVTAAGAVQQVSLDTAGSGRADLSRLLAEHVQANIRGSAQVDLAPREDADISIAGSGDVAVHGTQARIRSHITGLGQIRQLP